jgi:hypothetical protein
VKFRFTRFESEFSIKLTAIKYECNWLFVNYTRILLWFLSVVFGSNSELILGFMFIFVWSENFTTIFDLSNIAFKICQAYGR